MSPTKINRTPYRDATKSFKEINDMLNVNFNVDVDENYVNSKDSTNEDKVVEFDDDEMSYKFTEGRPQTQQDDDEDSDTEIIRKNSICFGSFNQR